MKRGRHAADDGSFGRSSGMAAGRGAALLAVAVVIGIVLLNAADNEPSRQVSAGGDATTTTVADEATTTLAPTTSTVPARAPKEVKVLSTNGTDVKGAARKATDVLRTAGFNVLAPVDFGKDVTASAVYFTDGFEREALAVATSLSLGPAVVKAMPTPPPLADTRGANVLVVVGPEVASRLVTPASASTTVTTRAGAATTSPSTTGTTRP